MKTLTISIVAASLSLGCTSLTPEQRAARTAADHARQAANEQRGEHEGLRNRYKRYSTPELLLMRRRYLELTAKTTGRDAGLAPGPSAVWGTPDRRHTEELIRIERELLRRWKTGDAAAHLPEFD